MARKKVEGGRLKSWTDVDDTLRQIAVLERKLVKLESEQNATIDKIKAQTSEQAEPIRATLKTLGADLKDYAERNRTEFLDQKTRALNFGKVGFRLSTKLVIKNVANTLSALLALGLNACVRTRQEPDKEAMRELSDDQLAAVGAARQKVDEFWFEVDATKLAEAA